MESIIRCLAITMAIIITYGFVNYNERNKSKKCKILYLPREE